MNNDNISSLATPLKVQDKPANPCILVIFGIAGDLTKRLLYPAICNLGSNGLLDKNFSIVGIAKEDFTTETFRQELKKNINEFIKDPSAKAFGLTLADHVDYISGNFSDANVYTTLKNQLVELAQKQGSENYLFYFAVPPDWIETIAKQLKHASLLKEENNHFRRIVIEKPFGHDVASAKKLNCTIISVVCAAKRFPVRI